MTTPIDTRQPSLALTELILTEGIFPSPARIDSIGLIGAIRNYAGSFVPSAGGDGVALANGQLLDISSHDALFSLIGTTYGGDGVNTFATPDLDVRTAVGTGPGPGLVNVNLGEQAGSQTVTLYQNNLPSSVGGSSFPFNEGQPYLGLNYLIALQGIFPSPGSGTAIHGMLGEVSLFGGNFAPKGYAFCQGQLLSIAVNQALFAILGTTYGGDGRVNFALPDLRGRTIVGEGAGPDGNYYSLGEKFGQAAVTLLNSNLPTEMGGGGQAANNQEPSLVLNYMIATSGLSGSFSNRTATIGEVGMFAGNFAPAGWLLCQGQLLAIADYADLYGVIGTTYGGDGVNTFALPDLRGRDIVGASDADGVGLGTELGSATFNITLDHVPGLTYDGTAGDDVLCGANQADTINGLGGNDTIRTWRGPDHVDGGDGDDVLIGGGGRDDLIGGNGRDRLIGSGGSDVLRGGAQADRLQGGDGRDLLIGGPGNDRLTGGADADVFLFKQASHGIDTITDWTPADGDTISISASGFGGGLAAGALDVNRLVLGTAATGAFGQFLYDAATGRLRWDADGTGAGHAVVVAHLMNGVTPTATLAVADFDILA